MPNFPIQRYLVPETETTAPSDEGFITVEERLTGGLPHRIRLDNTLTMILILPTGLATAWRDLDPVTLVSSSAPEYAPRNLEIQDLPRTLPRLIVRQGAQSAASVPLVAGKRVVVPRAGGVISRRFELIILNWEIYSGSVRGAGDYGSRLTFAWRWIDIPTNRYSIPPVPLVVKIRLPLPQRVQSETGRLKPYKYLIYRSVRIRRL